MLSIKNSSML